MGACSSVEVIDHDFPTLSKPLPPGLSAALSSQKEALSSGSNETSSPSIVPVSDPLVHPSLLASLTAAASRASLSTSTTATSASKRASNRNSTSTSISKAQPTLRLGSLTLDHDDDNPQIIADTPTAANSRRVTGEGKTEQIKVAPLATAAIAYNSNVSPKHADQTEVRRGAALLNGNRQERVAAEEREQTAWQDTKTKGKVEEEKTADDAGETKRSSGRSRFSIIKSKPASAKPLTHAPIVEPLTPPSPPPVVINYITVDHTTVPQASSVAATMDAKSAGALKKSTSVDGGLKLPAAPGIATQRISSEVAILDVIRQLGRSQAVSVNTLSQYTRCVPAVLSGPLTRSPRGSGVAACALPCCAKLQCMQCGMDVMMLDHHRWVADVKADMFRTSYPEVARLRSSLVAAVGSRAYCCACSWADVKEQVQVNEQLCVGGGESKDRIRWVCAGHQ